MINHEIILETNYKSIIFHDKAVIFTDIDSLFRETNTYFAKILQSLYQNISYDFSNKYNKSLYTHSFLNIIVEHINAQKLPYGLYFYSNVMSKDQFRNSLLKKLKSIFGFKIYEGIVEFSTIIEKIENNDCELLPLLEIFFLQDTRPKTFKHIKKYLEKNGLKMMNDTYFKDIANKLVVMA